MHVTDMPLEQLLIDMDCIFMYQDLVNSKIKIDQVFDLKLDDVKSLRAPIGDLKRFIKAIQFTYPKHSNYPRSTFEETHWRERKIEIAGSKNDYSHIHVLLIELS